MHWPHSLSFLAYIGTWNCHIKS